MPQFFIDQKVQVQQIKIQWIYCATTSWKIAFLMVSNWWVQLIQINQLSGTMNHNHADRSTNSVMFHVDATVSKKNCKDKKYINYWMILTQLNVQIILESFISTQQRAQTIADRYKRKKYCTSCKWYSGGKDMSFPVFMHV